MASGRALVVSAEGGQAPRHDKLSTALADVCRVLIENGGSGPVPWLFRHMQRSWISVACNIVFIVVLLVDMTNTSRTMAMRVPLRMFFGAISSNAAILVWKTNAKGAKEAMDNAVSLVRIVAQCAGPKQISRLQAAALRVRRVQRVYWTFMAMTIVSVVVTLAADSDKRNIKGIFIAQSAIRCILGYYTLVALQLSLCIAAVELLFQIPLQLTVKAGAETSRRAAVLLARARDLCRALDRVWHPYVPAILLTAIIMPLVSIADLVVHPEEPDVFAVVAVPVIFIVFVPLCFEGQRLKDASRRVGERCYEGPWLSEAAGARRHRLLLMMSTARPTALHLYASNTLDRPTCNYALRKWFGFIQVLVNLKS